MNTNILRQRIPRYVVCISNSEMAQSVLHRSIADGLRALLEIDMDPNVAIVDAIKQLEDGLVQFELYQNQVETGVLQYRQRVTQLEAGVVQNEERIIQLETLYTQLQYAQRNTFGACQVLEEVRHLPKTLVSISCDTNSLPNQSSTSFRPDCFP